MDKILLTRDEAAARLGVTSYWLKRMATARVVPFTRLGPQTFRWSEEQVEEIARMFAQTPKAMPVRRLRSDP